MYYLQIDNKGLTTTLIQYSPEKDEKRILLDGNLHDGYISELKSDGKQLYVFVSKENGKTYCFRYQPDKGEIKPYIVMDSTDGLTVSERFMTWINWSKPDDRMHTMYYMLDIENNLLYKYEGSEIVQADNQMIWTKFLKKENSIPKGEIFQKGNSQLMWFKF